MTAVAILRAMGWRISFGVGPLRYSAPLTRRRRQTRRHVQQPPASPAYQRSPQQVRKDRRFAFIGYAIVAVIVIFWVTAALISG